MVSAIRGQVMGSGRDQPVFHVATMEQIILASLARRRFAMFLLGAFAVLALALAAFVLSAVALVASYIPARRAMRVDPMVALRHE